MWLPAVTVCHAGAGFIAIVPPPIVKLQLPICVPSSNRSRLRFALAEDHVPVTWIALNPAGQSVVSAGVTSVVPPPPGHVNVPDTFDVPLPPPEPDAPSCAIITGADHDAEGIDTVAVLAVARASVLHSGLPSEVGTFCVHESIDPDSVAVAKVYVVASDGTVGREPDLK